ncbi:MAG: hypothetical protein UT39_C0002G0076 [Candidatus Woesebacteria bacterium GW2011_GWA1_39_21]|uniref:Uncharacterized protein n=1 Tax=Candidatus Woesebacteria bacterium GW2011_GWA1_39_21 TaxID=1618550 RepID=A0A0G0QNC7_9BACT|nr:MAG: hypothetical protein UT39_C0002G0076 [Candidatus Woesebacteria bacterium GW2011_GWA1_39_21]
MHQTKLIYFYALTIAALILFALIVGGIVEIKVPVPEFTKPSPELTLTKLKTLCSFEKFEAVAISSLKFVDGKYSEIAKADLSVGVSKDRVDYLAEAKTLCNWFDISRKIDRKQISEREREYRFYAGILFDSNKAYHIRLENGHWKFVLGN